MNRPIMTGVRRMRSIGGVGTDGLQMQYRLQARASTCMAHHVKCCGGKNIKKTLLNTHLVRGQRDVGGGGLLMGRWRGLKCNKECQR